MGKKRSIAAGVSLEKLQKQYLDAGREVAEYRQDEALLQDMSALWDELIQVLAAVNKLPPEYLTISDDWPDRPAGERQRYMSAHLAANFARDYTDGGWQALQKAVGRAEKSRQYLQDRTEALRKTERSKRELEGMAVDDKIKDLEAQLKDLRGRQAEIHRGEVEGRSLDDPIRRELSRLAQKIEDAEALLEANRALRRFVYNPDNASLLFDFDLHVLNSMREELDKARKDHRAVIVRRLTRKIERWGSMVVIATLIFFLGKFSDHYLVWPLAAAAAFMLWLADVVFMEPSLRRRDAKRMRQGLLADATKMYSHKNTIRMQQADYNQELRKAGMGEVALFPVASQAPIENWIRDLVRSALGGSPE